MMRSSKSLHEPASTGRRRAALLLTLTYLTATHLPATVALAAPGLFARPGAGVTRLPLQMAAFDAPGFGDVEDAINLATGSLYLGSDALSYNSTLAETDDKSALFSGNWSLTSRERLHGFAPTMLQKTTAPIAEWPLVANTNPSNLVLIGDPGNFFWTSVDTKPGVTPSVFRLQSKDYPPQPDVRRYTSGLKRLESTPAGTYEVSFEGRANATTGAGSSGALSVRYGLNDANLSSANLTGAWTTFTTTVTTTSTSDTLFQIFEDWPSNPSWELRNISVKRIQSGTTPSNLVTTQDLSSAYWSGYNLKPAVTTGGGSTGGFSGADNSPATGDYRSGVTHTVALPGANYYTLSFNVTNPSPAPQVFVDLFVNGVKSTRGPYTSTGGAPLAVSFPVYASGNVQIAFYENTPSNGPWKIDSVSFKAAMGGALNLVTTQDFSQSAWGPYPVKPPMGGASTLASADFDDPNYVSPGAGASGLMRAETVPSGRYRVSFDAKAVTGTLGVTFGMGAAARSTATLDGTWRRVSADFSLPTGSDRLVEFFESTAVNPDWDVAHVSVQRLGDVNSAVDAVNPSNLVTQPDLRQAYWSPVFVAPPATATGYRFAPADGNVTVDAPGRSGAAHPKSNLQPYYQPGKFLVSFDVRADTPLKVKFDLGVGTPVSVDATPTWQRVSQEIDVLAYPSQVLRLYEDVLQNPAWEVANLEVRQTAARREPGASAPDTMSLGLGDGTMQQYDKVSVDARYPVSPDPTRKEYNPSEVPTWITQYLANTNAYLYRLASRPGVRYAQDWIVLIGRPDPTDPNKLLSVAHHYTSDGNRTTFAKDGEYVDYTQTASEQYRSALAGNPDGAQGPRTELTYMESNSGRLQRVQDAWGRVTDYKYVTPQTPSDTRVKQIDMLLQPGGTQYARTVVLDYSAAGLLTDLTFKTTVGGVVPDRTIKLHYAGNAVQSIVRPTPVEGGVPLTTTYTYLNGRIQSADVPGEGLITYTPTANGVIVTQNGRNTTYVLNANGTIQSRQVGNSAVNTTKYNYDPYGAISSIEYPGGKVESFYYDARGNTTREEVKLGVNGPEVRSVAREYDRNNGLKQVVTVGENRLEETFTPTYRSIDTVTFGAVSEVGATLVSRAADNTTKTLRTTKTSFNEQGLLARTEENWDGNSAATVYNYDASTPFADLPASITETANGRAGPASLSRVTTYGYDVLGQRTREESAGKLITRVLSGFGQPLREEVKSTSTDAPLDAPSLQVWTYHPSGHLKTLAQGTEANVATYLYNAQGQLETLETVGDTPQTKYRTSYSYDSFGRLKTESRDGFVTSYEYDELDRETKKTFVGDAGTNVVVDTTYHPTGAILHQREVDGRFTHTIDNSEIDALGRVGTTEYNKGQQGVNDKYTVVTQYDKDDRPTTITDSRHVAAGTGNGVTTIKYDVFGRERERVEPGGKKVTWTRDAHGNVLTEVVDQNPQGSATTTTVYDGWNRPHRITDPIGRAVDIEYDARGYEKSRVLSKTDVPAGTPTSVTTETTHDVLGRLKVRKDAKGKTRTFTYDALGNVLTETDERQILIKKNTYTVDGFLKSVEEPRLNGSGLVETETRTYAARRGLPDTISRRNMDGLSTTTYTYSVSGKVLTTSGPGTASTSNQYDNQGNLRVAVDANGVTTTYEYDRFDRLKSKDEAGNHLDFHGSYGYDAAGNLLTKTENGLTTTYAQYDGAGRPQQETSPGFPAKTLGYRADGLLINEKVNGTEVRKQYDAAGNLTEELALKPGGSLHHKSTFTYNLHGLRHARQFEGDSGVYALPRTSAGADPTTVGNLVSYTTQWRYDLNGNLMEQWDQHPDSTHRHNAFGYTYTPTNKVETSTWDVTVRVKNLFSQNSLTGWGGSSGVPMAATKGNSSAQYNARDLLRSATLNDESPVVGAVGPNLHSQVGEQVNRATLYTYYESGQRRTVETSGSKGGGNTLTYVYDDRGRVTQENKAGGNVTTTYSGIQETKTTAVGTMSHTAISRGGRLTREVTSGLCGSDGTRVYTYHATGQVATITTSDPQTGECSLPQGETRNVYDSVGRLSNSTFTPTGGQGVSVSTTTVYSYDGQSGFQVGESYIRTTREYGSTLEEIYSTTYDLDAFGNRLQVNSDDRYKRLNGFKKRYDAEGRVAEFSYFHGQTGFCNPFDQSVCNSGVNRQFNFFRYDPQGRQIVSAETGMIEAPLPGEKIVYNEHSIKRRNNTSLYVGDELVVVRNREGEYLCKSRPYETCTDYARNYNGNDSFKDRTYTLADGFRDKVTWTGTVYFDLPRGDAQGDEKSLLPALPALTNRLGVNADTAQAPAVTPGLGGTAPSETPSGGLVLPSVGYGPLGTPPAPSPRLPGAGTSGQDAPLEVAQSVLPPALRSFTPQSVSSTDPNAVTLPNIGLSGPQTVTPPQAVTPNLGISPAGGSSGVLPPSNGVNPGLTPSLGVTPPGVSGGSPGDTRALNTATFDAASGGGGSLDEYEQQQLEVEAKRLNISVAELKVRWAVDELKRWVQEQKWSPEFKRARAEELEKLKDLARPGSLTPAEALAFVGAVSIALKGATDQGQAKAVTEYGRDIALLARNDPGRARELMAQIADKWLDANTFRKASATASLVDLARFGASALRNLGRRGNPSTTRPTGRTTPRSLVGARLLNEAEDVARSCFRNSFSPDTPVWTLAGLMPIALVRLGTPVLAFDEQSGKSSYQPVTEVFKHDDPRVTYLGLEGPQKGQIEAVTTTPEHPFYVKERSDLTPRPKPQGHKDLSEKWVGAGHLKVGDKILRADGTTGTVKFVNTVSETRTMYNLDVAVADTFFVGTGGWLAHNADKTTMFRVEGNINGRFNIDTKGNLTLNPNDRRMLYIAFNDDHAIYFLEKRMAQGVEGAKIIGVEVDPKFLERLRKDAVPQRLGRQFPGRPQLSDPTIGKDLYGVPAEYFDDLQKSIIQGTAFEICGD